MNKTREINKLLKQRKAILNQDYMFLTDAKREKSWSRLENIDKRLKQLNKPNH
jgi:hypothetical protein